MKNKHIYFPGLHGLRGIAAFAVVIPHINIHLHLFDKSFTLDQLNPLNYHIADLAVTFFFYLKWLSDYLFASQRKTADWQNCHSCLLQKKNTQNMAFILPDHRYCCLDCLSI